ncbi:MotE family protein [Paenibacillus motobuensis]|uniref:Magnesium transporter MgtE intracellular domain-containing protein n=1 Tax=Paenibacillus motobuensis TaxID=295324 RepID=A0ABN0YHB8_9BACL
MAKNEVELDEQLEESGGGFTRFLFFVTPIIFLIVMLTVLMALFNMNFRDTLFDFGKQIPIVKNWIPDDGSPEAKKKEETKLQEKSSEATIKQLKEQLAKQESQLQEANSKAQEQSDQVKKLQDALDTERDASSKAAQEEQDANYLKEVKKLSQIYAEMSPSKAAAIFDKLTEEETLQMFSVMSNDSKVAILEKMDPQKAADISIKLKDVKPSEDLNIAALQSRLKKEAEIGSTAANKGLDDAQLSATFASMSTESAAKLILQTYKISPEKSLKILRAIDDSTRSKIMTAMTDQDEKASVKILNQLVAK